MLNEFDGKVIRTFVIAIVVVLCTYFVTGADIRIELDHMVTPVSLDDGDATTEPADSYGITEDQARQI